MIKLTWIYWQLYGFTFAFVHFTTINIGTHNKGIAKGFTLKQKLVRYVAAPKSLAQVFRIKPCNCFRLKPIQYFSDAVMVFLKGKWPVELQHVPRYLVLEWLSTFVFSRKSTFVDLLATTLAGHAHLHTDWTFHDPTGQWQSFRGRSQNDPTLWFQDGPIWPNQCLFSVAFCSYGKSSCGRI